MDADAIFMYKTIQANYKHVSIVTELASMQAIAFLISQSETDNYSNSKDEHDVKYFATKPFAAGEIYVSAILSSLMC